MRGMQAGLLAGVSAAALFCAAGAHAQAADEPTTVEDIVVTAQKREQSLQSVPVAVTAYRRDHARAGRPVERRRRPGGAERRDRPAEIGRASCRERV